MQPYLDLLIEAEHVASLDLNDTQRYRVVDLCRASVYRQVHLPNAIHLMPKQLVAQRNDATGVLPDVAQLQALIEQLQLTAQHHVLVYDDEGGGWASRLIWTLHCLGFEQVSLINGGLHACLAAGIAMTNEIPQLQAQGELLSVDLSILKRWQIDYDELLQQVQHGSPSVQLWDCRSEDEYLGERMAARRAGHIPTALHYDWCQLFCRERQLKLYPLAEIQQQLQQRGFDLSQPVVVYCQSHHRSSLAYVVARLLHWSVRAYDGAWSEWGNESHSPIHSGAEP